MQRVNARCGAWLPVGWMAMLLGLVPTFALAQIDSGSYSAVSSW